MGTRNLIAVMVGGEYKVAQYSQWDGYPDGQGIEILSFLRDRLDREKFLDRLALAFQPTQEQCAEYDARLAKENKTVRELYPSLSRDTGGKILELIQESPDPVPLRLSLGFAGESDCEWAWVVDFDRDTFEGYKGYNKTPLPPEERFANIEVKDEWDKNNGYQPVRLVETFPLGDLPGDDDFLAAFGIVREKQKPDAT